MKTFLNKLKNALEIPFDPLDEKTNRDAIISGLLNIAIAVTIAYSIPLTAARGFSSSPVRIMLITFFVFITLRIAVNKGHTQIVSLVLLFVFWMAILYEFLRLENGLRAPAYTAALAFIFAYAGILHGYKTAWILAGISILINIVVAVGETNGYYLTEPKTPDIWWAVLGQEIFLTGIIYMLNKTLRNFRKSISLYKAESKNRLKAESDVRQLHEELEIAYETTLEGWAQALELRDKETEGHSRRVTKLSKKLAYEIGLNDEEIQYICYGALLHDIGKMGIPDEILNKPGPLTPAEREIINQHPTFAYEMLKNIEYLQPAISIPYSHHERWDGTGYPQGLKGEEIPLPARIFSIIDNWDALMSARPYRDAWPRDKVVAYIQAQSGNFFDPKIVEIFLKRIVTKA